MFEHPLRGTYQHLFTCKILEVEDPPPPTNLISEVKNQGLDFFGYSKYSKTITHWSSAQSLVKKMIR